MTSFLISMGITRDSFIWFWSRLTMGAILITTGFVPLDPYVGYKWANFIHILSVVILWLAGKYDSSPLPGAGANNHVIN